MTRLVRSILAGIAVALVASAMFTPFSGSWWMFTAGLNILTSLPDRAAEG